MNLKKLLLTVSIITSAALSQAQPVPRNIKTDNYKSLQENLAKGWNTWYNNNILSHVLLPQGFAINVCFTKAGTGEFLKEVITHQRDVSTLGMRSNNGSYTSMTLNYKNINYLIESATDGKDQFILVTPEKPSNNQLIIEAAILYGNSGTIGSNDNRLQGRFENKEINVSFSHRPITNSYSGSTAPHYVLPLNEEVAIMTGHEKSLAQVKSIITANRTKQQAVINSYGELSEPYKAMQAIISWNTVYDPANKRIISPVSRAWSRGWGGFVIFDWDNYFAAYMSGLFNKELAYANAIEITKAITPSGFIPNYQAPYSNTTYDRSQPPIGSLVVSQLYKRYKDKWLLEETYDELLSWNRWWAENRDIKGYIAWGSNDITDNDKEAIMEAHRKAAKEAGVSVESVYDNISPTYYNMEAAALESGLDNSPMYDNIPFNEQTSTMELADVGLMSMYIMDCNALKEIAEVLGKKEDIKELTQRATKYTKSLSTMWDEKSGIFLNKRTDTGELSNVLSPTNFYPMLAKACTQKQAETMIERHYYNKDEFYGEYIMPSSTRNNPASKDDDYWRGRIWAPMNFLVYTGMRNYKLDEARKDLVAKSKNLLLKSWHEAGAICENYNAETGIGGVQGGSNSFYHWGALLTFMSFIEDGYMEPIK